nr:mitotic-spindle organizing protein 2 isoform X1 [Hydra vulgaris]
MPKINRAPLKTCFAMVKMERKTNAIHKPKNTQPDLYRVDVDGKVIYTGGKNKSVDEELFELCALSGVKMDIDVFNIVIDLLRTNVNPNTILDVFKKMSNQQPQNIKSKSKADKVLMTKTSSETQSDKLSEQYKNVEVI